MAVSPLQDILGQLARARTALIDEEIQLYFRDVHDHAVRINESTDTLREMLTAAMSVNLSLVTVRAGRGGQAPGRLGGAAGRADADRQLVRHELQAHAGAGRAARATRS